MRKLNASLESAVKELRERAYVAMERIAGLLTEYAKAHHPWQNRTGETERTTQAAITEVSAEIVRVTLSADTRAAEFLELAHDGKWAWLWPVLVACEPEIRAILKGMGGS